METLYVWAPPFLIGELRRDKNDQSVLGTMKNGWKIQIDSHSPTR